MLSMFTVIDHHSAWFGSDLLEQYHDSETVTLWWVYTSYICKAWLILAHWKKSFCMVILPVWLKKEKEKKKRTLQCVSAVQEMIQRTAVHCEIISFFAAQMIFAWNMASCDAFINLLICNSFMNILKMLLAMIKTEATQKHKRRPMGKCLS